MVACHVSLTPPRIPPWKQSPSEASHPCTGPPWGRLREAGFTREPEGALGVSMSNPPAPDPILQMTKLRPREQGSTRSHCVRGRVPGSAPTFEGLEGIGLSRACCDLSQSPRLALACLPISPPSQGPPHPPQPQKPEQPPRRYAGSHQAGKEKPKYLVWAEGAGFRSCPVALPPGPMPGTTSQRGVSPHTLTRPVAPSQIFFTQTYSGSRNATIHYSSWVKASSRPRAKFPFPRVVPAAERSDSNNNNGNSCMHRGVQFTYSFHMPHGLITAL